jgi:hypothetical protein
MKTAATFCNQHIFGSTNRTKRVEISDIAEIGGKRGHVTKIGRKYVEVLIYGGKRLKVDPLADGVTWTGEQHN